MVGTKPLGAQKHSQDFDVRMGGTEPLGTAKIWKKGYRWWGTKPLGAQAQPRFDGRNAYGHEDNCNGRWHGATW